MSFILTFLFLLDIQQVHANADTFRFSLYIEPHTFDPAKMSGNENSYIVSNLLRGLYKFSDKDGLIPLGAESCKKISPLKLKCSLNKKMRWSDQSVVEAEDYVRSFRHFINPNTKSKEAGLLINLKSAKDILNGKARPDTLGISAPNKTTIIFDFEQSDEDFLYKLSSPVLVPLKVIPVKGDAKTYIFNGPYKIKEWVNGKSATLEPNLLYPFGNKNRPQIEILFIEETSTVVDLYRLKKIDFVTELSFLDITFYKNKQDFIRTPMARFDYIGFGDKTLQDKHLREALSYGVNYQEFVKAFDAIGRPGCVGLPDSFMDRSPCLDFDLERAKKSYKKIKNKSIRLKLYFTKIGSNNLAPIAEWYQAQWKKNIGLNIEIQAMEFAMYRQKLQTQPPTLFRVGISLDRPTCLAALEVFKSTSPDNFVGLKDNKYDELLDQLSKDSSQKKRQILCRQAVERLLKNHVIIPQGKIHFGRLLNPEFKGLSINSMGHTDFSNLHKVPGSFSEP